MIPMQSIWKYLGLKGQGSYCLSDVHTQLPQAKLLLCTHAKVVRTVLHNREHVQQEASSFPNYSLGVQLKPRINSISFASTVVAVLGVIMIINKKWRSSKNVYFMRKFIVSRFPPRKFTVSRNDRYRHFRLFSTACLGNDNPTCPMRQTFLDRHTSSGMFQIC